MRLNRNIFTLFIATSLAIFVGLNILKSPLQTPIAPLVVAVPQASDISAFDTSKIENITQYNMIRALASPLIEFDNNYQITSAVAEKFDFITPQELVFKIRDDLQTIDGHRIDAYDVYISLMRQIVLRSNTHLNLDLIVCDLSKIKTINDQCSGISYDRNKNTVTLKLVRHSNFLLPLFANLDYAIIPANSIDPVNLKIIDYRNTSGPYFYAGKTVDGMLVLKANEGHWHISKNSPKEIHIFPDSFDDQVKKPKSFRLFMENKVNFIPTSGLWPRSLIKEAKDQNPEVETYKTLPIGLSFYKWTNRGRTRSPEERLLIGEILQGQFHKIIADRNDADLVLTQQMFPEGAFGRIPDKQLNDLSNNAKKSNANHTKSNYDICIAVSSVIKSELERYNSGISEKLKIKYVDFDDGSNEADLILMSLDISYEEDGSLLSFALKNALLTPDGLNEETWLNKFVNEPDFSVRKEMVEQIVAYSVFKNPSLIPLMFLPYFAAANGGWKIEFTPKLVRSPFWQVTR